jgi:hypothetical protein
MPGRAGVSSPAATVLPPLLNSSTAGRHLLGLLLRRIGAVRPSVDERGETVVMIEDGKGFRG